MQIEELPKLLKESEGIAHIRCGICLRIVMSKDEGSGLVEEECPESKQIIEVKCPDCGGSGKVEEVED